MKRYDRLKAEGICAQCGQEWARPGKTRCEKCATWTQEYYKRKRDERMSRGLCLNCGKAVKHGDLRCPECRRKVNEVSLRCYHARMARMKGLNDGGGAV